LKNWIAEGVTSEVNDSTGYTKRTPRAYCPNIYTVTYTVDNICGVTS
jgi:hypothetical protein